jgi:uncharacterized protein (TIGR03086 family)
MSEHLRIYTRALDGFDDVVRLVPAERWDAPSPCEGWTARDVVGHVIGVQRYVETLARGTQATINPWEDPGSIAGADPPAAWSRLRDDVLEALDHPGVIDRVVDTFRGPEPVDAALAWNVVDTLAHTWDLARAAGIDLELDPELVEHALAETASISQPLRDAGWFGTEAETPPDATPTQRFLAVCGRPA